MAETSRNAGKYLKKGLNLMDDYFPSLRKRFIRFLDLPSWKSRLKEVRRVKKVNILIFFILVLAMRLFFYSGFWGDKARAEQIAANPTVNWEVVNPLSRVEDNLEKEDPIKESAEVCQESNLKKSDEKSGSGLDKDKVHSLTSGHPIEEMIPFIVKRNRKTASFLIAIAKKESDWGKHVPTKKGKDCYNYWGYRGGENPTESGYSCFDSPKQAVSVVGNRIDELIGKHIDTPQEMLVWKCGASCAGQNSQDVKKWVSDVDLYYGKLNS